MTPRLTDATVGAYSLSRQVLLSSTRKKSGRRAAALLTVKGYAGSELAGASGAGSGVSEPVDPAVPEAVALFGMLGSASPLAWKLSHAPAATTPSRTIPT